MTKIAMPCPTCMRSTRKGLLWLGGGDWLTCPSCEGTSVLQATEHRYTPKEKLVFVPGSAMRVQRDHYLPEMKEER
jgi:hypothetical protein